MRHKDFGVFTPRNLRCNFDGFDMFDDDSDDSGGGGSAIISQIIGGAVQVLDTRTLANANPVNAAIITNQPISTPYVQTGMAATSKTWLVIGGLGLAALLTFAAIGEKR